MSTTSCSFRTALTVDTFTCSGATGNQPHLASNVCHPLSLEALGMCIVVFPTLGALDALSSQTQLKHHLKVPVGYLWLKWQSVEVEVDLYTVHIATNGVWEQPDLLNIIWIFGKRVVVVECAAAAAERQSVCEPEGVFKCFQQVSEISC